MGFPLDGLVLTPLRRMRSVRAARELVRVIWVIAVATYLGGDGGGCKEVLSSSLACSDGSDSGTGCRDVGEEPGSIEVPESGGALSTSGEAGRSCFVTLPNTPPIDRLRQLLALHGTHRVLN